MAETKQMKATTIQIPKHLKGNIQLLLGDCLQEMQKIAEHSVDVIISDPPFTFAGGISNGQQTMASNQFFLHWWKDVCKQLARILKPEGEGFLWCDWRSASTFAEGFAIDQTYTWKLAQMIYHYREMPGMGSPFRSSVDMIAYIRGPKAEDKGRIPNTTHNMISKYWYYGKHDYHPAEKDPEMVKKLLDWCSDEGMTVIDPFMGSGTTGIACKQTNRRFIGIEMDERYFEVAKKRIDEAIIPLGMPNLEVVTQPQSTLENYHESP